MSSLLYVSRQRKWKSFVSGILQVVSGMVTIMTLGWVGTSLNMRWSEIQHSQTPLYKKWFPNINSWGDFFLEITLMFLTIVLTLMGGAAVLSWGMMMGELVTELWWS